MPTPSCPVKRPAIRGNDPVRLPAPLPPGRRHPLFNGAAIMAADPARPVARPAHSQAITDGAPGRWRPEGSGTAFPQMGGRP